MTETIITIWTASLALLSALLSYPLVRYSSRFQWFGVAAIALLFAMACQTQTQPPTIPKYAGTFAYQPDITPDITTAEAKVFEAVQHQFLALKKRQAIEEPE